MKCFPLKGKFFPGGEANEDNRAVNTIRWYTQRFALTHSFHKINMQCHLLIINLAEEYFEPI